MPSILSDADKETVKRFVPKQNNKIQAVAVARLYVAYPDPLRWTYTGLQGAVVLANDLVGNTYWLKMVDISVSGADDLDKTCVWLAKLRRANKHCCSPACKELYGTRSYSTHGSTTKTVPSSIPSSSKTVWPLYALWTRKRQRHSRRRWRKGKRTAAKQLERHLSEELRQAHQQGATSTVC